MNAGTIAVQAFVTHNDADDMLRAIDKALEPVSMSAFLRSQMLPELRRRARARFGNEGDEASGPWAELRPATVDIREAMGYPGEHPINRRSGALERWVTGADAAVAGYSTGDGTGAQMTWPATEPTGTLGKKYRTAQKGRPNQREKSPTTVPRPVVAVNQADMNFFTTAWSIWFAAEFLKAKGSGSATT